MGEQVVQVAGDAQAFLGDAAAGLLLAGAFGAFGTFDDRGDVLAVKRTIDAEEQDGDDPAGDPQELHDLVRVGDGCVHDQRARRGRRQPVSSVRRAVPVTAIV